MVLREKEHKMASEQPVKKKLRRDDEDHNADEPDFIQPNGMHTDLSSLQLSLPANVNEEDINSINELKSPDLYYHPPPILHYGSELIMPNPSEHLPVIEERITRPPLQTSYERQDVFQDYLIKGK